MARSKYGNLAPKNAAAVARRREGMKRFDSADWMMNKSTGKEDEGEPAMQPVKKSLLARTLEAEVSKPQ